MFVSCTFILSLHTIQKLQNGTTRQNRIKKSSSQNGNNQSHNWGPHLLGKIWSHRRRLFLKGGRKRGRGRRRVRGGRERSGFQSREIRGGGREGKGSGTVRGEPGRELVLGGKVLFEGQRGNVVLGGHSLGLGAPMLSMIAHILPTYQFNFLQFLYFIMKDTDNFRLRLAETDVSDVGFN